MKAVVLTGGSGTRLRPLTYATPKQLLPVGGIPVLGHVVQDLVRAGIQDVAFVTSAFSAPFVRDFVGDGRQHGIWPSFLMQDEPNGLAAAYDLARDFIADSSSLLYLGDCLITGGISHAIDHHRAVKADATVLVEPVTNPERYGVTVTDSTGRVVRLAEKSADPPSDLALVGVYIFGPGFGRYASSVAPSARGELEITDAIDDLVQDGGEVHALRISGWWMDVGTLEDLLDAHRRILNEREPGPIRGLVSDSSIEGLVQVDAGSAVSSSVLTGPTVIGRDSSVVASSLGPYAAVGERAAVVDATLENCIIMDRSIVRGVHLVDSVVGPGSQIVGSTRHGAAVTVVVGAESRVDLAASHSG